MKLEEIFENLTQEKLDKYFDDKDIKVELLSHPKMSAQNWLSLPGIIWTYNEDIRNYKDVLENARYNKYAFITPTGFTTELDKENYKNYEEYFIHKLDSKYLPKLKFEESARYEDTLTNVDEIIKINDKPIECYANIDISFLYDLKFNKDNIYNYPGYPYEGTTITLDPFCFRKSYIQCKIPCNDVFYEGLADFFTLDELTCKNVFIKIPIGESFDYNNYRYISLDKASKEDIDLSIEFNNYIIKTICGSENFIDVLNKISLFDGKFTDKEDYISEFAKINNYEEIEDIPDVIWMTLIDDVQFYDSQADYYGFLSTRNGYEITFEENGKNSIRISSKNIKVYRKDNKMVTFSFIDFNNVLI